MYKNWKQIGTGRLRTNWQNKKLLDNFWSNRWIWKVQKAKNSSKSRRFKKTRRSTKRFRRSKRLNWNLEGPEQWVALQLEQKMIFWGLYPQLSITQWLVIIGSFVVVATFKCAVVVNPWAFLSVIEAHCKISNQFWICNTFWNIFWEICTWVWKQLIGWNKLEPQGRIVAATFFPAVKYLHHSRQCTFQILD